MRQQIFSLQVFRGLAALAVVGYHTVTSTGAFVGEMPRWVHNTIGQGNFGVDFFFVLSGFIIMYIHRHDDKSINSVSRYLKKRFFRVFPIYWCVAILLALAYSLLPALSASGGREISLISSVLLLPGGGLPILGVAWTLIHEVMFYSIFLLFFLNNRIFLSFILLWVASILTLNALGEVPSGAGRYFFSLLNVEFVIGMGAALYLKRMDSQRFSALFAISGITLGIISIYLINIGGDVAIRLCFALGMAMLIIGAVGFERQKALVWPSFLVLLGNASYSIYLVHNPALSITQRLFGKVGASWEISLLGGILITTLFGVIFHLVIEKNVLNNSQKIFKPRPA
ncbi:acyltransferase [Vibrio alginolyticus]